MWEKCHGATSTHLQKLQINNKIRAIARESNRRLERPWMQFDDFTRAALVAEVQRHPDVGAKYGLTKDDCNLLIKTICRDYCRNRGASERRRLKAGAGDAGWEVGEAPATPTPAPIGAGAPAAQMTPLMASVVENDI